MKRIIAVEITNESYKLFLASFASLLLQDLSQPAVFDEKLKQMLVDTTLQVGCLSGMVLGRLNTKVERDLQRTAILKGIMAAIEIGESSADEFQISKGDL